MNASDPSQVKKLSRAERIARINEINDLKFILSHPQGRRYIWGYLKRCNVTESIFSVSPNQMYFLEGSRNVGLKMLADLMEADPDAYLKMIAEAKGEELEKKDASDEAKSPEGE